MKIHPNSAERLRSHQEEPIVGELQVYKQIN